MRTSLAMKTKKETLSADNTSLYALIIGVLEKKVKKNLINLKEKGDYSANRCSAGNHAAFAA
ncbi:MAG: hypothetical protein KH275_08465 [Clostridiales bacterium]|nr:hypothetical protein [Clostridiales bacterium]